MVILGDDDLWVFGLVVRAADVPAVLAVEDEELLEWLLSLSEPSELGGLGGRTGGDEVLGPLAVADVEVS